MKNKSHVIDNFLFSKSEETENSAKSLSYPLVKAGSQTCILHAHMSNIAKPGSYNTEINKLFKLNKLPKVHLPDNPPSFDTLNMTNARTRRGRRTRDRGQGGGRQESRGGRDEN